MALISAFWTFSIILSGQTIRGTNPDLSPNLPALRIGRNDLVSISVYDSPEFTRVVRIGPDGSMRIPMLKSKVMAEGLMPADLEIAVAKALRDEGLVIDPVVSVTVAEYQSRTISVAGAVRKPITFQATGSLTLLEALAKAEGIAPDAGAEILVSRPRIVDGVTSALVQRITVKGLIDAADPELNVKLTGGEEIRVPEAGKVFVVGNVRRPGAFRTDGPETTVLKALALAEGLAPYANKQAYIFRRDASSGAKNEITIELKQVLERKKADIPLLPNDILYVPDNAGRRASFAALEKLIGFGTATASGMLIWGSAR